MATDQQVDELDTMGVIFALERICELESRMRQAIQQTHPLTTTMEWDFAAADREREALLAISEHLEYLEDKLREYRFNSNNTSDNKAVILAQIDSARRELLESVENNVHYIVFSKDIVREVLAFASVGGEESPRPSGFNSARTSAATVTAGTLLGMVASPKKDYSRASTPGRVGTSAHDNQLWEEDGAAVGSRIAARRRPPAGIEPAPMLRSSYNALPDLDTEPARYNRYTVGASSPDVGLPDAGSTPESTRARRKLNLRGSMNGGTGIGNTAKRDLTSPIHIQDEDIYGPPIPTARSNSTTDAAAATPRTVANNYGGVLRIRDMLDRAEKGLKEVAEAQEQRRIPARIISAEEAAAAAAAANGPGTSVPPSIIDDDVLSQWEATTVISDMGGSIAPSVRDWQNTHISVEDALSPRSDVHSITGAAGAVFGKVAGLAFVLGSIAAAGMAINTFSTPAKAARTRRSQQQQRKSPGARKTMYTDTARKSSEPADMPPWADGSEGKYITPMGARGSPGRNKSKGDWRSKQPPVALVTDPPTGRSFPMVPPPDVSSVMG